MKKNKKRLLISVIMLLVLSIGIGYAYISSNLSITGSTKISSNTWDIHFNNIVVDNGSVSIPTGYQAATIDNSDTTKITYSILLNRPGDYYEFTVDIVNSGTIDGMIENVISKVNNQDISNLPEYLTYEITYLDGDPLMNNFLLSSNTTETIRVRIEFNEDIEENDLLDTEEVLNFSLNVNYRQAKNAINRLDTYNLYWNNYGGGELGTDVTSLGTTYDSVEEVLANTTYPFFIRSSLRRSNRVQQSDVGFKLDDTVYYLIGGGATYDEVTDIWDYTNVAYETNKTTLLNAFGSANCTEHHETFFNGEPYDYMECTKSGLSASADSHGYVYVLDDDWRCYVNSDGSSTCYDIYCS